MSRDWTPEELARVSSSMKKAGHLSFEEFCAALDLQTSKKTPKEPNPQPVLGGYPQVVVDKCE